MTVTVVLVLPDARSDSTKAAAALAALRAAGWTFEPARRSGLRAIRVFDLTSSEAAELKTRDEWLRSGGSILGRWSESTFDSWDGTTRTLDGRILPGDANEQTGQDG